MLMSKDKERQRERDKEYQRARVVVVERGLLEGWYVGKTPRNGRVPCLLLLLLVLTEYSPFEMISFCGFPTPAPSQNTPRETSPIILANIAASAAAATAALSRPPRPSLNRVHSRAADQKFTGLWPVCVPSAFSGSRENCRKMGREGGVGRGET